jgi:hypothetical protein
LAERSNAIQGTQKKDKFTSVAHALGGGALSCGGNKCKKENFINSSKLAQKWYASRAKFAMRSDESLKVHLEKQTFMC